MSELNSFLSSSSDNFMSPEKSESCSDYDETSKFKLKKNSYKDAPKLIRCPMNGCTQKFPWNSSLMRHILTHTGKLTNTHAHSSFIGILPFSSQTFPVYPLFEMLLHEIQPRATHAPSAWNQGQSVTNQEHDITGQEY